MAEAVHVRLANPNDAALIASFNRTMARETEDRDLDEAVVLAGVQAVLADPDHGFYVVAESDGSVVGSLLVTFEWSDWRNAVFWWIQSVYVLPRFRRRGVFRELFGFLRERASEVGGVCGSRLYVERENATARRTYEALGMGETSYRIYEAEWPRACPPAHRMVEDATDDRAGTGHRF